MKIRNGFVSNSSSTSFTFCFKGEGYKPLTDLILTRYDDCFNRSWDEYTCTAYDVTRSIKEACLFGGLKTVSIDNIIYSDKEQIKYLERDIKNSKLDYAKGYFLKHIQELKAKIKKLQTIKKKGLTTVLIIGFGDNSGTVCGGDVGMAMDYDGRDIDINEKDLVIFTEQNR